MEVIEFTKEYIDAVYDIQKQAYKPLYEKYRDDETSPYMESKETVLKKYTKQNTTGYVFIEDSIPVGAVRVWESISGVHGISALAVLPKYQNRRIAQTALLEIEKKHPEAWCWTLDTIMEESGNCHLYEKLGYVRTGEPKPVNERLTLVDYTKTIQK